MNIGSVSIANIPKKIEESIQHAEVSVSGVMTPNVLYDEFISTIKELQNSKTEKRNANGEIEYSLEKYLSYLVAQEYIADLNPDSIKLKYLSDLIKTIKHGLFELCDIEKLPNASWLSDEEKKNLDKDKTFYHAKFVKKILQRPLNLKRANIFTTNYDLAFEYAFDKLGVISICGFCGFQKRTFKPEAFEYDLFFPGSTTQGRVQRIEKVAHYYKIHGSLTWVKELPSESNVYGISEVPIEIIRDKKNFDSIIIYPTTAKKSFTLDFPYSELFRKFASAISQSQSVLFTYGYSFNDEHVNDIIYQALTVPSFTLIIIDFNGTKTSTEIQKLKELKDPRVIILQGEQLGSLSFFVENLLPDLIEINTQEKIAETLRKLLEDDSDETPITTTPII